MISLPNNWGVFDIYDLHSDLLQYTNNKTESCGNVLLQFNSFENCLSMRLGRFSDHAEIIKSGIGWGIDRWDVRQNTSPRNQGAVSIRKTVLPVMAIPMLKIRRPNGRLIFNMEIAIRR